jgi:uncharacterized protein YdeI (YjbR/CyaY-like superfamily)
MIPRRPCYSMPDIVKMMLKENGLDEAYANRHPYQQNDFLMWIGQVRCEETRTRRINQMLEELMAGNVYMKMQRNPKRAVGRED